MAAFQAFLGPQHKEIKDGACGFCIGGQPVVEVVAHGIFDHAVCFDRGQSILGLADEFWLADEAGHQCTGACGQVFAGDCGGFFVADQFAVGFDTLKDCSPKASLVCSALGCGDRVAVGLDEAVARRGPVDGPFDFAGDLEFFETGLRRRLLRLGTFR